MAHCPITLAEMLARMLLVCGFAVLFVAIQSATAAPSAQGGFMADSGNCSSSLLSMLRLIKYGGGERLDRVEAELFAAFQTVPKNEFGRIEVRSARHLVQVYLMKEHAWQLAGLEPHGFMDQVPHVKDMAVLQEKAPAVASALAEAGDSPHGLALGDIASLVVILERLVFDEYLDVLQKAYRVNGFSPSQALKAQEMDLVMSSFLLAGHPAGEEHIVLYLHDTVRNDRFALGSSNPFREIALTFEDVTRVADRLIGGFGPMMNEDCLAAWDHFHPLSSQGLFHLDEFLTPEIEALGFVLRESVDYIEDVGALDPATKRVRLANYMAGPSNCFHHTSSYYGICCMSECDPVMHEIMHRIQKPEAPPEQVAAVVANISSRYVEAPRQLPKALTSRLQEIAEYHDGNVRLHSRLFAQWLHSAFPSECPFPHKAKNSTLLRIDYWSEDVVLHDSDSAIVKQRQQEAATVAEQARKQPSPPDASSRQLRADEEVLYLASGRPASRFSFFAWRLPGLHWLTAFALLLAVRRHLALVWSAGQQRLVRRMAAGGEVKEAHRRLAASSRREPAATLYSV